MNPAQLVGDQQIKISVREIALRHIYYKTTIMRIQETDEYRLVKQLTTEENRVRLRKALIVVPAFMGIAYGAMIASMELILYIWAI